MADFKESWTGGVPFADWMRQTLVDTLDLFWNHNYRDVSHFNINGNHVIIVGETSWGDVNGNFINACMLAESGITVSPLDRV